LHRPTSSLDFQKKTHNKKRHRGHRQGLSLPSEFIPSSTWLDIVSKNHSFSPTPAGSLYSKKDRESSKDKATATDGPCFLNAKQPTTSSSSHHKTPPMLRELPKHHDDKKPPEAPKTAESPRSTATTSEDGLIIRATPPSLSRHYSTPSTTSSSSSSTNHPTLATAVKPQEVSAQARRLAALSGAPRRPNRQRSLEDFQVDNKNKDNTNDNDNNNQNYNYNDNNNQNYNYNYNQLDVASGSPSSNSSKNTNYTRWGDKSQKEQARRLWRSLSTTTDNDDDDDNDNDADEDLSDASSCGTSASEWKEMCARTA
jgi:hypothetical protein